MTLKEYLSEKDHFASDAGVELLEIKEGYARARMLVQLKHLNGGGVCQGGAILHWPIWLSPLLPIAIKYLRCPYRRISVFSAPSPTDIYMQRLWNWSIIKKSLI